MRGLISENAMLLRHFIIRPKFVHRTHSRILPENGQRFEDFLDFRDVRLVDTIDFWEIKRAKPYSKDKGELSANGERRNVRRFGRKNIPRSETETNHPERQTKRLSILLPGTDGEFRHYDNSHRSATRSAAFPCCAGLRSWKRLRRKISKDTILRPNRMSRRRQSPKRQQRTKQTPASFRTPKKRFCVGNPRVGAC